jgi:hypothetical protein
MIENKHTKTNTQQDINKAFPSPSPDPSRSRSPALTPLAEHFLFSPKQNPRKNENRFAF